MSYNGKTYYKNRRMLISDPNGSIFYLGSTWSLYGVTESNMDEYGNPILGNYLDINGNQTYFTDFYGESCSAPPCYTYVVTSEYYTGFAWTDCNNITRHAEIRSTSEPNWFCAIQGTIITNGGTYTETEECSTYDCNLIIFGATYSINDDRTAIIIGVTGSVPLDVLSGTHPLTIEVSDSSSNYYKWDFSSDIGAVTDIITAVNNGLTMSIDVFGQGIQNNLIYTIDIKATVHKNGVVCNKQVSYTDTPQPHIFVCDTVNLSYEQDIFFSFDIPITPSNGYLVSYTNYIGSTFNETFTTADVILGNQYDNGSDIIPLISCTGYTEWVISLNFAHDEPTQTSVRHHSATGSITAYFDGYSTSATFSIPEV